MTDPSVANARFQLLDRPLTLPGKCAVCGTADRSVVDFGADVDWFGAIYLCVSCLTEAAATIGMVSAERVSVAEQQAGQFIRDYLIDNDLMVVSSEWYERAADLFGGLPVSDAYIGLPDRIEDSGPAREEVSGQLELPIGEVDGTNGESAVSESDSPVGTDEPTGQNDSPASSKRPARVSKRTSNDTELAGIISL